MVTVNAPTKPVATLPFSSTGIGHGVAVDVNGAASRSQNDVWVTDFLGVDPSTVSGQDSFNCAPRINAAIDYVASKGGGTVRFPSGFDARCATPIIMKRGVGLKGAKPVTVVDAQNMRSSVIRPSANMTALITQADITQILHSASIEDIVIDGRSATLTVDNAILLSPVNVRIKNCEIQRFTGVGIYFKENAVAAWINWIEGNSIQYCAQWGIRMEGTDSVISNNYISNNGNRAGGTGGAIWTKTYGGLRWSGNQIELGHYGMLCESRDTGIFAVDSEFIQNNFFDLNNIHLHFKKGALGSDVLGSIIVCGNKFNNTTTVDILSDGYHKYVTVTANSFTMGTPPSSCHIDFGTGGPSAGWVLAGNTYTLGISARYLNLPSDVAVLDSGNGFYGQFPDLRIGSTVKAANLTVAGSNTYRGQTTVAAAFGVTHADQNTASAAVLLGSLTGNTPFVAASRYGASNAVASPLVFITDNAIRAAVSPTGDFQMVGGSYVTVIDSNRIFRLRTYAVSTLPTPGTAGRLVYVSDAVSFKRLAVDDGTNWRFPDGAIVS